MSDDPWMRGGESGVHYRLQITAKTEFIFQHIPEDTSAVQAVERDILSHVDKFMEIWNEAFSDPNVRKAWLEKSPQPISGELPAENPEEQ